MGGGLPTGGQGSKVYVLCAEPKELKRFRPGTRPGGIGFPAGRIGDRGDSEIVYVPNVYVPFPAPIEKVQNEKPPNSLNFQPEFYSEKCSEGSQIIRGLSGNGNHRKFIKNPPVFKAKSPGKLKEKNQKSSLHGGEQANQSRWLWRSPRRKSRSVPECKDRTPNIF